MILPVELKSASPRHVTVVKNQSVISIHVPEAPPFVNICSALGCVRISKSKKEADWMALTTTIYIIS